MQIAPASLQRPKYRRRRRWTLRVRGKVCQLLSRIFTGIMSFDPEGMDACKFQTNKKGTERSQFWAKLVTSFAPLHILFQRVQLKAGRTFSVRCWMQSMAYNPQPKVPMPLPLRVSFRLCSRRVLWIFKLSSYLMACRKSRLPQAAKA